MPLLKLEIKGAVALLSLNRPELMNALGSVGDGEVIRRVCEQISSDPAIRCAVLTGEGRGFSAGGDVKAMLAGEGVFGGGGTAIREKYRREIHVLSRALYELEVPLVAAVNGPAIGLGCDIACLADVRIASERARFGVTFLKVGLIPGDGGAWLLQRVVGYSRAAEMLYTGEVIDAETAAEWGLVSRVVPHERLLDEAFAIAERIAEQPPQTLRMAKSLLRQGRDSSYPALMEFSAAAQGLCHLTDDHREGVNAILEKRKPTFKGC
ncbi:MAG: crotonase/enoyl-CoA hydratase family protein [Pseudomonas sp.]|uniref:crotonase/enoyl-CoA hydratase family protein n=1 Tax=Pseudomonas sp. TaxID=306 RepID=UPI003981C5F7